MNHRELILCSIKKPRYSFMALPHDLQDQLMEEVESNRLSCGAASKQLQEKGYMISHAAIAAYCFAVRMRRRTLTKTPELVQAIRAQQAKNVDVQEGQAQV